MTRSKVPLDLASSEKISPIYRRALPLHPLTSCLAHNKLFSSPGASSGFGRLIAKTLAGKNYRVFATMRNLNGRNAAAAREASRGE
jgi:hypothetical protein